jgi:cytidylate kinase
MKRILVVEREYGAGGSIIAEKLAQRLGWKLLDHELTAEIARLAKVNTDECKQREERIDPWLYRLAKVFWRGSQQHTVQFNDADILDADRLICLTQQVVEQAAEVGHCVIVGRAAPYFLRNRDDTFCVFLYASRELKYQRVRARTATDEEAITLVDTVDQERADFIKYYFKVQWPSRHLYHAMLNTAAGEEETVNTIINLMRDSGEKPGAGTK